MTLAATQERSPYAEINMTPLIDVMLVLLIIFIITIPIQTHAIKLDNPSSTASATQSEVIDLSIDFDGTLSWNGRPVDRPTLQGYISREATKTVPPEVHIAVDKFSKYEVVAQTLADLEARGLNKIGFVNTDSY